MIQVVNKSYLFKIVLASSEIPALETQSKQSLSTRRLSQTRIKPSMALSTAVLAVEGLRKPSGKQPLLHRSWRMAGIALATSFFISIPELQAANPSATTVSVVIPALVQISGLSNITLAPISFSSPVTGATTACIYTNAINPIGSYYVTATSTNASSGVFRVTNSGQFISYSAFWSLSSSPAQTIPLTSGVKTTQLSGGNSTSLTCSGTPNANFNISFTNLQVAGASTGTYTDTVTLLVSPS